MHLQKLTVSGFKSFASARTLQFDAPITAIVGPNGSGKSNVVEAFRFVLGEQSPSRLRGKKGEDLIWGGTHSRARGNRASVALELDNTDRTFPIDFETITIERTVHRDGQNEYRINDSVVRLKDITELLAVANIGPTGHHIISQGEADRILSATHKERREMIEDALGLKQFQIKKAESERKLEQTRANIAKAESLRREIAPHLKYLKRQVTKMERAAELRTELGAKLSAYLAREHRYCVAKRAVLDTARREPEAQKADLTERIAQLTKATEDAKRDGADARDEARQALHEKCEAADAALATARQNRASIAGKLEFLETQEKELQAKRAEATDTIPRARVTDVVSEIERIIARHESSDDIRTVKRAYTEIQHALRRLVGGTDSDVSEDEKDNNAFAQTRSAFTEELEQAKRAVADAESVAEKAHAALRTYDESTRASEHEAHEAERALFAAKNALRECEQQLRDIDQATEQLTRDEAAFADEVREGVALVGRMVSGYKDEAVLDERGEVATDDAILAEDRSEQRERQREIEKMKIRLEELGGTDENVVREYEETKERDEFLAREIEDLAASVAKLTALIAELNEQIHDTFAAGITKITTEFDRFFTLMFGGGSAQLSLVPLRGTEVSEDKAGEERTHAEQGIEIEVSLPNKRVRGLGMLSGGERALTSIALIFAMSQINPPLFIVLDETDAALDEANSRRYGDMIEALAKRSQLILVTHNRETMRRAGVLYGVTMQADGVSQLLSVKLEEALQTAK